MNLSDLTTEDFKQCFETEKFYQYVHCDTCLLSDLCDDLILKRELKPDG